MLPNPTRLPLLPIISILTVSPPSGCHVYRAGVGGCERGGVDACRAQRRGGLGWWLGRWLGQKENTRQQHNNSITPAHLQHTSSTPPAHLQHTNITPTAHQQHTNSTPTSHHQHTTNTPPAHHQHTTSTPPAQHQHTTAHHQHT